MLTEWLIVGLTITGVILIPAVAFLVRGTMKWTHTSDKIDVVAQDVSELKTDVQTMNASFDRRMRFMEEMWMRRGGINSGDHTSK